MMIATFVFEVVDSPYRDHRIVFDTALLKSQELHHHISCKLQWPHTIMHLQVFCRVCLTDAVVSHQLAKRMAMYRRLLYKMIDLYTGFCTVRTGEALELIDDEVHGFKVLKPVCEKVDLCKK